MSNPNTNSVLTAQLRSAANGLDPFLAAPLEVFDGAIKRYRAESRER